MIKLMVHLVKIVIAACIALLFNSCKLEKAFGESVTGSGNVVSKERNVSNFTKIEVSRGLDCEVTQSDKTQVTVVADDNVEEGITTVVENGTLKISSKYSNYNNVASKTVKVNLPKVDVLETTSGSYLVTKNTIKSTDIHLKSSSGSTLDANVESDKVTLESTSGSTINAEGKALEVSTASSSGSTINAEKLMSNDVTSQSTSGSSTTIHPIVSLKAKASSGSSIDYVKAPQKISKEESSGGSVDLN